MTAEAEPDTRVVSEPETTEALPAISAEPPPPPRRRRIPALVLAVTALHIALMAMLTILYPAFTGPDETFHVDMAYAYSKGHGPYPPAGRPLARGVEVANNGLKVPPPDGPYADTPVRPRGQRPSFDAAGGDTPAQGYPVPNQMVQHPPLYYLIEAGVLRLPGVDRLPYDRQVALLRWVSIILVAPLPLLAWATARRLLGDGPIALTASVLPVAIPGVSHIGALVNNDNLMILLAGLLTLTLAGVIEGDLRARTGAVVGLLLGLALLTKGFALVLPVAVAAVYLVAWLRHRRHPLVALAVAAVVSAGVGGWWWVRNVVLFHALQPDGLGPRWGAVFAGAPRPGHTWDQAPGVFFPRFSARFWGGLGYPDQPQMPEWITYAWLILFAAGALVGIAFGIGGRWGRAAAATLALPMLGFTALIFYGAGKSYVFNGRLPGIQARYVYGGLTAMAVLFAIGVVRLAGRLGRFVPLVLLAAGLLTQAWAWRVVISSWWVPRDTVGDRWKMFRGAYDALLRWSPWPTVPTVAPFIAVALLSIVALVAAALAGRQAPRPAVATHSTVQPERPSPTPETSTIQTPQTSTMDASSVDESGTGKSTVDDAAADDPAVDRPAVARPAE